MEDFQHIWEQFDKVQSEENEIPTKEKKTDICKNCKSLNIDSYERELICNNCGFVIESFNLIGNTYYFNETSSLSTQSINKNYSKNISKLQQWMMYSNEEKNQYKLKNYTQDLCEKLDIDKSIVDIISKTVIDVMEIIKENDGTKRARVKDGIIIVCIQYVSRKFQKNFDTVSLAKKIGLNVKYITKAEKIILPLLHSNKIKFDKTNFLHAEEPFYFIEQVICKYNLNIPKSIIFQLQQTIELCRQHDILLDHTPQSIGICCFYFILKLNNIELDTKMFTSLYNISMVTLLKTYGKLNNYSHFFEKNGIVALK